MSWGINQGLAVSGIQLEMSNLCNPLNKECPFLKTNSKSNSIKMKMKLTQMLLLLELLLPLLHMLKPL